MRASGRLGWKALSGVAIAALILCAGANASFGSPPDATAPGADPLAPIDVAPTGSDTASTANPTSSPGATAPLDMAPSTIDAPLPAPVPEPADAVAARLLILEKAIDAEMTRLAETEDKRNPLGAGDWRAARLEIRAFYAARDDAPIWVGEAGLTQAGAAALKQLKRAGDDGLDLSALGLPDDVAPGLPPERLAEIETTLATAVVVYAEQASGSRVPPARISPAITAFPDVADAARTLHDVSTAGDPGATLADYNPPQAGYRTLRVELARLDGATPVAEAPGNVGDQVLDNEGGSPSRLIGVSTGIESGGRLAARRSDARVAARDSAGPRGVRVASDAVPERDGDPVVRRRAAILANMEMWRWEPRDMGERRIEVNIPDFSLSLTEGGEVVHTARIIVGKPTTPTPIFSSALKYIVVNPAWSVPESIVKKEMLPKLATDPDYLAKHGYEVTQVGDRISVRQPPGADNALGRIAFMFPNEHSVYLHDTPSRGLFQSPRRAFSHGCVRVEQPMRLAELVMGGAETGWPERRFESMLGPSERTVWLNQPLAIHIEYFTEFVDASGELQERDDLYGIAGRVAGILLDKSQG